MFLTVWVSYFLLLNQLGSLIKMQIPESQPIPRGSEPLWMRSEKSGMWTSQLPWVTLQYKDQCKNSQDKTLQCYSSPCFSAGLWSFPCKSLSKHLSSKGPYNEQNIIFKYQLTSLCLILKAPKSQQSRQQISWLCHFGSIFEKDLKKSYKIAWQWVPA